MVVIASNICPSTVFRLPIEGYVPGFWGQWFVAD